MRIGELSRRTGVSVRMLRYYESEGLLKPARTSVGYRSYGEAEEQTVRRIRMLIAAGLKLKTIQRLLPCVRDDRPDFQPCDELRSILRHEVATLDGRLKELGDSRRILAGYPAQSKESA